MEANGGSRCEYCWNPTGATIMAVQFWAPKGPWKNGDLRGQKDLAGSHLIFTNSASAVSHSNSATVSGGMKLRLRLTQLRATGSTKHNRLVYGSGGFFILFLTKSPYPFSNKISYNYNYNCYS